MVLASRVGLTFARVAAGLALTAPGSLGCTCDSTASKSPAPSESLPTREAEDPNQAEHEARPQRDPSLPEATIPLLPGLTQTLPRLFAEFESIPEDRRKRLRGLALFLKAKMSTGVQPTILFVGRTDEGAPQLGKTWATAAATYFGLRGVRIYSAGNHPAETDPQTLSALRSAGFELMAPDTTHPHYRVEFSKKVPPIPLLSETLDGLEEPLAHLAVVATCPSVELCPEVEGAELRVELPYPNPRDREASRETSSRPESDDPQSRPMGTEMFYVFSRIKTQRAALGASRPTPTP